MVSLCVMGCRRKDHNGQVGAWNNGKEMGDGRWEMGDVNKQGIGDSQPKGARHSDTAANHTDLQSGCGRPCVFAVCVWSNL